MRSATLSGWHGFTFSNMTSPLPCPEQSLHQIILGRHLPVIGAAVFLHNLEDLVPEPHRLVHVVDADVDKRGRNRAFLRGRMLGKEPPCGWSSPRTESSGALHMAYRSNSCGDNLCGTADFLQPLPGFRINFLCLERTSVTLLGG